MIKTSCPSCAKSYVVDQKEIRENRPQFDCTKCQSRFGFSLSELNETSTKSSSTRSVKSYLIPWQAMPAMIEDLPAEVQPAAITQLSKDCPKCGFSNQPGQAECGKCGIVFEKLEARKRNTGKIIEMPRGDRRVEVAWKSVLDSYENENAHHDFLQVCLKRDMLAFAAQKYEAILSADPTEEMAATMKRRVMVLAQAPIELKLDQEAEAHNQRVLASAERVSQWLWAGVSLGLIGIIASVFYPPMRIYDGIFSFATIASAMMLLFLSQKRRKTSF